MSFLIISAALGFKLVDPDAKSLRVTSGRLQDGMRSFFRQFRYGDLWLAGLLLGFSSAMRIAAPLIGVVILVYILLSRKWEAAPRLPEIIKAALTNGKAQGSQLEIKRPEGYFRKYRCVVQTLRHAQNKPSGRSA